MLNLKNIEDILNKHQNSLKKNMQVSSAKIEEKSVLSSYILDIEAKSKFFRTRAIEELPFHLFEKFDMDGNRTSYEKVYFERRCRLTVFASLYWLYGRNEDKQELEDILWAICGEFTWALPAHMEGKSIKKDVDPYIIDLFAAETAQSIAEIIYYLGGNISSVVVGRCEKEIRDRVLNVFSSAKKTFNWERMKNNWCAVCGGSIGMTAIYQIKNEKVLAKILYKILPTLQNFLESFEEDGACLEGISYWTYGVLYYTAFVDLLNKRTDGEINLFKEKKFIKIAKFQQNCYFNDGQTISFADGYSREKYNMGLTSYLIKYFGKGIIKPPPRECAGGFDADHCYRWCSVFRVLLWTDETILRTHTIKKECVVFPKAQWMICKDESGAGFAIKGGHNDEPHNHNDAGSFLLYMRGGELLSDLGAGEYTKKYFSDERYSIFCNNSLSHSVPIINDKMQSPGRKFCAKLIDFSSDGVVCLDLAKAYDDASLKNLFREVSFKKNELLLKDTYVFDKCPRIVKERFITKQKPEINEEKVTIYTEKNEAACIFYKAGTFDVFVNKYSHISHEKNVPQQIYAIDFSVKSLKPTIELVFSIQWN